jgi:hypothetical protein
VVYAAWTPEGYAGEDSHQSLEQLALTGASHVAIVVTAYMNDLQDNTVEPRDDRTPTVSAVRAALTKARDLGLSPVLKPHVDVVGGAYRGTIRPADPSQWFETYRLFLLPWAELAEEEGCDSFWLGTELPSMTRWPERWRHLADEVRAVFSGPLVYAANWMDIDRENTWALARIVDIIGVDAYFPLSDWPNPTVTDMVAGWQPWLLAIERLSQVTGRPVYITEVGCMSRVGCPVSPWSYGGGDRLDAEVQARYYEATLRALSSCSVVEGVFFWGWGIAPAGPDDGDHSPRNKPAEAVLQRWWAR